jgi:UDP-glucose 4-epimerase
MAWLITGGAGYIGSHVVRAMTNSGYSVIVLDDFSTGSKFRVPAEIPLFRGSVTDYDYIKSILATNTVEGVIHLAAKKSVAESTTLQELYSNTNIVGTGNVVKACIEFGVKNLIFASTAAVYSSNNSGETLSEAASLSPENHYGFTKLEAENILINAQKAHDLNLIIFRFFNVTGTLLPSLEEINSPNLLPTIRRSIEAGFPLEVFGTDFPTPDGTCIRDYLHVLDVADAHTLAADFLSVSKNTSSTIMNLGSGQGFSVLEVITEIELKIGRKIHWENAPRRPEDPARMVCDPSKAKQWLQWATQRSPFQDASSWA